MRAVVVDQPGGIEALRLAEVPTPAPGPREVLIRTAAASVNWGDVQKRQNIYPDPVVFPAILGMEVAGVVGAVGSDLPKTWVGRRVTALGGPRLVGGYAESISVPVEYLLPLPDDIDWRTAAAFPLASLTGVAHPAERSNGRARRCRSHPCDQRVCRARARTDRGPVRRNGDRYGR